MDGSTKPTAAVEEEGTSRKQAKDVELTEHDIFVTYDEIRPDDEDSGFRDGHDVSNAVDTTILNMYERAVSSTHESEMTSEPRNHHKNNSRQRKPSPKKWIVGSRCLAPYYEDNMWYPAVIEKLYWRSGECEVVYEGYGNAAVVSISDLAGIDDGGSAKANISSNNGDCGDPNKGNVTAERPRMSEELFQRGLHSLPAVAPPPPPSFLNRTATMEGEDVEANMLVSWYMCGYHTGYRQAIKDVSRRTAATDSASGY